MGCHLCGQKCVGRLQGRRTVLSGKVLYLCNACEHDARRTDANSREEKSSLLRAVLKKAEEAAA